jgi:hypothetical protein
MNDLKTASEALELRHPILNLHALNGFRSDSAQPARLWIIIRYPYFFIP